MAWNDILELYSLPVVDPNEYEKLYESDNVLFQFFNLKKLNLGIGRKMYSVSPKTRIPGFREPDKEPKYTIQIGLTEPWPANNFYLILQRTKSVNQIYNCNKFPGKCSYSTRDKSKLEKHEESCVDETKIKSRQIIMGLCDTDRKEIIKAGKFLQYVKKS